MALIERPADFLEHSTFAKSSACSDPAHSSIHLKTNDCARSGMCGASACDDVCEESSIQSGSTVGSDSWESDSLSACTLNGDRIICGPMYDRLSGGHLEAGRLVPSLHRRSNSSAMTFDRCRDDGDSEARSRRGGASAMVTSGGGHARRHAYVCVDMCMRHACCADNVTRARCEYGMACRWIRTHSGSSAIKF